MTDYHSAKPHSIDAEENLLRALIVEDSENDTLLLVDHLEQAGFNLEWLCVDSEPAMIKALDQPWDIVFSDYSMPNFNGERALKILKQHDPDIPFIFVSGTIGETTAVECMKAGAQNYVMKGDLRRLVPVIYRELQEAQLRRDTRQTEQTLRKLSLAVAQTTDSVFITDLEGKIEYVNPAFIQLTGYAANEAIGHTPSLIKSSLQDTNFYKRLWETILAGMPFHAVFINSRKDGTSFYEEKVITPLTDSEQHVTHFVSTGRDITDRIHIEESHAQLMAILEATTDFVAMMDSTGQLQYLNHAGRVMLGFEDTNEINTINIADLLPEWAVKHLSIEEAFPLARSIGVWNGESAILNRNGEEIPVSQVVVTHLGENGDLKFFSTIARDITDRKRYEQELQKQATHDALTGLPNRIMLQDYLERELARAKRNKLMLAVMFIDVDNFKRINDSLGHTAGDALLCGVAQRLSSYLRPNDLIARYGGDEFTIVVGGIATLDDVAVIAKKLRDAFTKPFQVPRQEIYVAFSSGISIFPNDGNEVETLLKNADVAMYRAKSIGRNQYQFYAAEMNAKGNELLSLETDLRYALERDEFELYYQPQLSFVSGQIVGFEALIRWHHPRRGLISPAEFIPLLEDTGLIIPVGAWVIHAACTHFRLRREAGQPPARISVNVSTRQFSDQTLVDVVTNALQENDMPAEFLELEITESTIMQNVKSAVEMLDALDVLGVRLAIDDFGTGYSSLAYLMRFPLDVLKIDQVFVRDIAYESNVRAIIEASISLGHKLGLEVIAEGVETVEQVDFLITQNCDILQGYYLSRPVPSAEAVTYTSTYRHTPKQA